MTLMTLLLFAGALIADSVSPGPTVAALVARVLSGGARGVLPFLIAVWLGEAIWLSAAMAGLAALTAMFSPIFIIMKWLGVAYLAYLAFQLLTTNAAVQDTEIPVNGDGIAGFFSGLSVSIGNPKNMIFYMTLLPSIIDMQVLTTKGRLQLVATLLVALVTIDLSWVLLAAKARQFLSNGRAVRRINQVSGGAMALAAAAIAAR